MSALCTDTRPDPSHSQSSVTEYERCPRRYWHGYVDRTPTDRLVPESWRFGTVVHAALEAALRAVQGTPRPVADAAGVAVAALRHSWVRESMPAAGLVGAEALVRRVVAADPTTGTTVLGVEQRFADRTPRGHRVAGVADLVRSPRPGVLEIVDHKVTRRRRAASALLADRQLNLYGWMARRRWPATRTVLAAHHYPLLGEVVRVRLRPERMAATVEAVDRIAGRALADESFAPTPGAHCGHCVFAHLCPEGAAAERS